MTHIDPFVIKSEIDYRRELAMASRPSRPRQRSRRLRWGRLRRATV